MLATPDGEDLIRFLVKCRFPHAGVDRDRGLDTSYLMSLQPEQLRTLDDMASYALDLLQKSPAELQALVDEERAMAERDEEFRFFNRPHTNADYSHWSKAAYWTLDEAAALSFGKAPKVVNWESVKAHVHCSPFAERYERLRDLIERAKYGKQLDEPVIPTTFIAWARESEIEFPPDLEAAVMARGQRVPDWKTLYDDIKQQLDAERLAFEGCKSELARAKLQLDQMCQRSDQLQTELTSAQKERDLHPKERETVLKMIIAMAIKGYVYQPMAPRTGVPGDIATDVHAVGLSIDQDTVRKWLREGAELLPQPIDAK